MRYTRLFVLCSGQAERKPTMSSWIDEAIREEMRKDMLRAAEREQLAARALAARSRPDRFYSPALARLGRRLEVWGRGLQLRYGTLADAGVGVSVGDRATRC
jgi:hypothetical protein